MQNIKELKGWNESLQSQKNPRPKRTTITNNQPQPVQPVAVVQQQQPVQQQPKARKKAPQELQRAPQQEVKRFRNII